jgi:hypothetical protein
VSLGQLLGETGRARLVAGCVKAGMTGEDAEKLARSLAKTK